MEFGGVVNKFSLIVIIITLNMILMWSAIACAGGNYRSFQMNIKAEKQNIIEGCFPLTLADANAFSVPQFNEYPAKEPFTGKPASVIIDSRDAKLFRTRLRRAASQGPNFAGHYTVATWGCGMSCISFATIDARSGRVYFHPGIIVIDRNHVDGDELNYRLDSRLLIVVGAPNEDQSREGIAYYEWTGKELKKLLFLRNMKTFCSDQNGEDLLPNN